MSITDSTHEELCDSVGEALIRVGVDIDVLADAAGIATRVCYAYLASLLRDEGYPGAAFVLDRLAS